MTWTPADHHRPTHDTRAVTNATEAAHPVDKLLANHGTAIHRTLDLMRTWADTGIRATRTDTTNGPTPMWCDLHQRDRRHCPVPELCPGHPYQPGADPVGELAADHRDQAATDHRELLRLLELRAATDTRIAHLADRYTSTRPRSAAGPGAHHCASCYRWKSTLTDVDLLPDGKPRYVGLCRWCGDFRAQHGTLPPIAVLEARHDPTKRVTAALIRTTLRPAKKTPKTHRARSANAWTASGPDQA